MKQFWTFRYFIMRLQNKHWLHHCRYYEILEFLAPQVPIMVCYYECVFLPSLRSEFKDNCFEKIPFLNYYIAMSIWCTVLGSKYFNTKIWEIPLASWQLVLGKNPISVTNHFLFLGGEILISAFNWTILLLKWSFVVVTCPTASIAPFLKYYRSQY